MFKNIQRCDSNLGRPENVMGAGQFTETETDQRELQVFTTATYYWNLIQICQTAIH